MGGKKCLLTTFLAWLSWLPGVWASFEVHADDGSDDIVVNGDDGREWVVEEVVSVDNISSPGVLVTRCGASTHGTDCHLTETSSQTRAGRHCQAHSTLSWEVTVTLSTAGCVTRVLPWVFIHSVILFWESSNILHYDKHISNFINYQLEEINGLVERNS